MSMYADRFGTDWETLDREEAVRRMYALGIAEVLDERPRGEYERILTRGATAYDRNVLELAFQEGKRKAKGARSGDGSRRSKTVWDELVGDGPDVLRRGGADGNDEEGEGDGDEGDGSDENPPERLPGAVERMPLLENDADEAERLRLPRLLDRGGR